MFIKRLSSIALALIASCCFWTTRAQDGSLISGSWRSSVLKAMESESVLFDEGRYRGGWSDAPEGYGIYLRDDGVIYVGKWKEGKRDGYGLLLRSVDWPFYYLDGCSFYTGYWSEDTQDGVCVGYDEVGNPLFAGGYSKGMRDRDLDEDLDDYQMNRFEAIDQGDGWVYVGETKDGLPDGCGMLVSPNGYIWYGEWKNGEGTEEGSILSEGEIIVNASSVKHKGGRKEAKDKLEDNLPPVYRTRFVIKAGASILDINRIKNTVTPRGSIGLYDLGGSRIGLEAGAGYGLGLSAEGITFNHADASMVIRLAKGFYPKAGAGYYFCKTAQGSGTPATGIYAVMGFTVIAGSHFCLEFGAKYFPEVTIRQSEMVATKVGASYEFPSDVQVLPGGLVPMVSIGLAF